MTVDLPVPGSAPEPAAPGCASCALAGVESLRRAGLPPGDPDAVVALAGNPNTGKSTVFNALTEIGRAHV